MHQNDKVKIQNIFYMLSYAYRIPRGDPLDNISADEEKNHDPFAALLAKGVGYQIKRGLHRDYIEKKEALAGLRSQIRVGETIKQLSHISGKLVCAFDEFSVDSPHNQALKCVTNLLLRRGNVGDINKNALRKRLLFFNDVSDVEPRTIRWDAMKFHRNNASYRWLIDICRLIVDGLHIEEKKGTYELRNWLRDREMETLYEEFVLGYYQTHYPTLKADSETMRWKLDEIKSEYDKTPLPFMKTDVTMIHGNKKLIIDTKYYYGTTSSPTRDRYIYKPDDLYQIFAYVENSHVNKNNKQNVAGLLLYVKTGKDDPLDDCYVLCGNKIGIKTLDLHKKWKGEEDDTIEKQLDKIIVEWLGVDAPEKTS
jgi:5-methylcytosine-specific restriction enzyme subunit McrC